MRRTLNEPTDPSTFTSSRLLRWTLLLAAFAALRVATAAHPPLTQPDTATYVRVSFLGHAPRPWTVPLLWSVLPGDGLREGFQLAFGVLAWSALALSVARSLSTAWVRALAVAGVLLLGLVPEVAGWDGTLLSESVSTSLLVLLVALLLALARRRSRSNLIACIVVLVLLVFTKQANALIFLALVPFVVTFAMLRLPRREGVWVVGALLLTALWSGYVITRPEGSRAWKGNAATIVVDRIAHDPSAARFFESRGFPARYLRSGRGETTVEATLDAVARDPRARAWISRRFRSTYFDLLSRHWVDTLLGPLVRVPRYFRAPPYSTEFRNVVPAPLNDGLWRTSEVVFFFELACVLALLGLAYRRRTPIHAGGVLLLLAAIVVVGAVIIWNSTDPAEEMARQLLPVLLLVHLGLLLAAAMASDAVAGSPSRAARAA
jgi:hypothetical protein